MTALFHFEPKPDTPIVCDFTDASDTPDERLAEYGHLFKSAFLSRQRTAESVVLTFASGDGVGAWVADLAAREAACCPFMRYEVTTDDKEIRWEVSGTPDMQPILDEYYEMYEEVATLANDELIGRFAARGFDVRASGQTRFEYIPAPGHATERSAG
jgi:hypothetical protein